MRTALKLLVPLFLSSLSAHASGNPAAIKCQEVGGEIHNVKSQLGEMGLCKIGEGYIDQWTLFRHLQGKDELAVYAYLQRNAPGNDDSKPVLKRANAVRSLPNPASAYCVKAGGELEKVTDVRGESHLCKFKDKSRIEEWTLFYGPLNERNKKLTDVLNMSNEQK